jgi:hypothetical protein
MDLIQDKEVGTARPGLPQDCLPILAIIPVQGQGMLESFHELTGEPGFPDLSWPGKEYHLAPEVGQNILRLLTNHDDYHAVYCRIVKTILHLIDGIRRRVAEYELNAR